MLNELDRTEGWSNISRKEKVNENKIVKGNFLYTLVCSQGAENSGKDMNLIIV